MPSDIKLPKYSVGIGDRFAQQAEAQLQAFVKAAKAGVDITPVWNKSNREHTIVGSEPSQTRAAADLAVKNVGWKKPYFCDADHINLQNVQRFIDPCDFFTIDVADQIAKAPPAGSARSFTSDHPELQQAIEISGLGALTISANFVEATANKYLAAVKAAADIYAVIEAKKGAGTFVAEISMDETDSPQTPSELLIILAAIADHKVPIQTIAPKFTGRFNKGVDYFGDVQQFAKEFSEDIAVIRHAIQEYGLRENLKLSVHSGSDKFSLYTAIHDVLQSTSAGLHVKTAGTTWLEEVIGLAESGGEGLELATEIYCQALDHREELCAPYASVIDIDESALPPCAVVKSWSAQQFTAALRHDENSPEYNSSFRQLLHVGFKVAAKMGKQYLEALAENRAIIAKNVTENLYIRHISPIFVG